VFEPCQAFISYSVTQDFEILIHSKLLAFNLGMEFEVRAFNMLLTVTKWSRFPVSSCVL